MIVTKCWEGPAPFKSWWAMFKCDCGYEHTVQIPGDPILVKWNTEQERKCPSCHSWGSSDKKAKLLVQKDMYEKKLSQILKEIEEITSQEVLSHG